MNRSRLFAVGLLLLATVARAEPPPRHYSVFELPIPGSVGAAGVNNLGHAIGTRSDYPDPYAPRFGFFWSPQTGAINLGRDYIPTAINDSDVLIGRSPNGPFRWSLATGPQLLTDMRDVVAINNSGQILGRHNPTPGATPIGGIRNADGTFFALPLPPNTGDFFGGGLSNAGDVTGTLYIVDPKTSNGVTLAHYWPPGGEAINLGDLPGSNVVSFADGVSADHRIIAGSGMAQTSPMTGAQRAVYWDQYLQIHEIGVLAGMDTSGTYDINDGGEVVGFSFKSPDGVHMRAFHWTLEEGIQDLNLLIDNPDNHWTLVIGNEINDAGVIAVGANYDGLNRGVLLIPDAHNPEPATTGLLSAISVVVLMRRRNR
jgi:uncharacterized membrane protein